jgi:superfamily II DNA/RNA helicase
MKFETLDINVSQFEAMNLPLELMTALGKMRISTPTAIQSSAIPAADRQDCPCGGEGGNGFRRGNAPHR